MATSVTNELGSGHQGMPLSVLDSAVYQESRWCPNCAGDVIFVPVYECEAGRVGVCLGCGEEKLVPFSRTTGEAA